MDGSSVSAAPNIRHPYTIRSRHAKFPADERRARRIQTLSIQLMRLTSGVSIQSAVARAMDRAAELAQGGRLAMRC